MSGPVAQSLVLSDHERAVLAGWVRRPTSSARLGAAVLDCVGVCGLGLGGRCRAPARVSAPTVSKWRDRFVSDRLDGLDDAPRPGQPRKLTDEQINALITRTLQDDPPSGTRTGRLGRWPPIKGLNQTQVSRIWRAFGLKPYAVDSWKLSKDPNFVEKVRDIVGLYMSPPENALVLAVAEKSQVQAPDRTAPILPMMPGTPARATHDYVRNGTTTLFAAMDIISGSVIGRTYRRHRSAEFLRFLKEVEAVTPKELDLPPRAGQLRHAQDAPGQGVAAQAPPSRAALHAHLGVLAQPRRTLVRRTHSPQTPALDPPLRHRTRERHHRLDQGLEREPQALRLDQDRRPNSRDPRRLLQTNQGLTTLVGVSLILERALADGVANEQIAARGGCLERGGVDVAWPYAEHGLAGLDDAPRTGCQRQVWITGARLSATRVADRAPSIVNRCREFARRRGPPGWTSLP